MPTSPALLAATAESDFDSALALALLRAMEESVYILDPDGRVTYVNRAGLDHLSLPPAAATGRFWWDLWPEVSRAEMRAALAAARDGDATVLECECPRRGPQTARCNVSLTPVLTGDGLALKLLVIARET